MPAILQRKQKPLVSDNSKTKTTKASLSTDMKVKILGTFNNQIIIIESPSKSTDQNTKDPIAVVSSDEETPDGGYIVEETSDDDFVLQHESEEEDEPSNQPEKLTLTLSTDYECDSCNESFDNRSSLIIHKTERSITRTREALREPIATYTCDMCKAKFTSKANFIRHYNNCGFVDVNALPESLRKQKLPARIPPRKKKSDSTEAGKSQKTSELSKDGLAPCQQCNKVFQKPKYLRVHMISAHGETISCHVCDEQFKSMNLLKEHIISVHDELNESCIQCGKVFFSRQSLKVHLAAHERAKRPVVCKLCDKVFKHEVYLRKHVQSFHVENQGRKTYRCDECGYESPYKTCFREHVAKHTGEDLVTCEVCGKKMRKGYHKLHMRIHTGERPEICEYCGKGFSARKYLKKHIVVHTGEKPYTCHLCGKSYTQNGTLTLHLRKHHPEEPEPAEKRYPWRFVGKNKRVRKHELEDEQTNEADGGDDQMEEMTVVKNEVDQTEVIYEEEIEEEQYENDEMHAVEQKVLIT